MIEDIIQEICVIIYFWKLNCHSLLCNKLVVFIFCIKVFSDNNICALFCWFFANDGWHYGFEAKA